MHAGKNVEELGTIVYQRCKSIKDEVYIANVYDNPTILQITLTLFDVESSAQHSLKVPYHEFSAFVKPGEVEAVDSTNESSVDIGPTNAEDRAARAPPAFTEADWIKACDVLALIDGDNKHSKRLVLTPPAPAPFAPEAGIRVFRKKKPKPLVRPRENVALNRKREENCTRKKARMHQVLVLEFEEQKREWARDKEEREERIAEAAEERRLQGEELRAETREKKNAWIAMQEKRDVRISEKELARLARWAEKEEEKRLHWENEKKQRVAVEKDSKRSEMAAKQDQKQQLEAKRAEAHRLEEILLGPGVAC